MKARLGRLSVFYGFHREPLVTGAGCFKALFLPLSQSCWGKKAKEKKGWMWKSGSLARCAHPVVSLEVSTQQSFTFSQLCLRLTSQTGSASLFSFFLRCLARPPGINQNSMSSGQIWLLGPSDRFSNSCGGAEQRWSCAAVSVRGHQTVGPCSHH